MTTSEMIHGKARADELARLWAEARRQFGQMLPCEECGGLPCMEGCVTPDESTTD